LRTPGHWWRGEDEAEKAEVLAHLLLPVAEQTPGNLEKFPTRSGPPSTLQRYHTTQRNQLHTDEVHIMSLDI